MKYCLRHALNLALVGGVLFACPPFLRGQTSSPSDNAPADQPSSDSREPVKLEDTDTNSAESGPESRVERRGRGWRSGPSDVAVVFGNDVEVKEGETAEVVVVFGGNATIKGKVREAVVVLGGTADISGEVGEDVVAVLGSVKVRTNALIKGDAVAVGGKVDVEDKASVRGQAVTVGSGHIKAPVWLAAWFKHCVMMLRPLAPQVGWVWWVAGVFFILYFLIALVFPSPVRACATQLSDRPATTFVMGLLAKLLLPVVFLILVGTGIGLIVVPFLFAALLFGALIGKAALLEALGFALTKHFRGGVAASPLVALLIGTAILLVLYIIPVIGLLAFSVTGIWGLGGAVTAAFGGLRREQAPIPAPEPGAGGLPVMAGTSPSAEPFRPAAPAPFGQAESAASTAAVAEPPVLSVPIPFPRAGFWERMGAAFLDVVLVGILGSLVGGPPLAFLVALAYFSGFWAWKGTTVGGVVLGLKVTRLDGEDVKFSVAVVRALAAAFSILFLFLGFLWIIWDSEKQGWHDKIAGTVVIKLPRGTPLICF